MRRRNKKNSRIIEGLELLSLVGGSFSIKFEGAFDVDDCCCGILGCICLVASSHKRRNVYVKFV